MARVDRSCSVATSIPLTPGPRKWVTNSWAPSPDQASAQGSFGTSTLALTDSDVASTSTTLASPEHATYTCRPSRDATTPMGSLPTATLARTAPDATSTA